MVRNQAVNVPSEDVKFVFHDPGIKFRVVEELHERWMRCMGGGQTLFGGGQTLFSCGKALFDGGQALFGHVLIVVFLNGRLFLLVGLDVDDTR